MTERQAWFCPACRKHHAPHCDSCPNPTVEVRPLPGVNVWPQPSTASPYIVPTPTAGDPLPPSWTSTCIAKAAACGDSFNNGYGAH